MTELAANNEVFIRLAFFFGIFAAVAVAGLAWPCRVLTTSKASRWFANISIVVTNTLVLHLLFPAAAAGMATRVAVRGWGLFNNVTIPGRPQWDDHRAQSLLRSLGAHPASDTRDALCESTGQLSH